MDDERTEQQKQEEEELETNPAGGMPEHEQAEEPGPATAGHDEGESIRELGAGM